MPKAMFYLLTGHYIYFWVVDHVQTFQIKHPEIADGFKRRCLESWASRDIEAYGGYRGQPTAETMCKSF